MIWTSNDYGTFGENGEVYERLKVSLDGPASQAKKLARSKGGGKGVKESCLFQEKTIFSEEKTLDLNLVMVFFEKNLWHQVVQLAS